jgi:hypothetical protein
MKKLIAIILISAMSFVSIANAEPLQQTTAQPTKTLDTNYTERNRNIVLGAGILLTMGVYYKYHSKNRVDVSYDTPKGMQKNVVLLKYQHIF